MSVPKSFLRYGTETVMEIFVAFLCPHIFFATFRKLRSFYYRRSDVFLSLISLFRVLVGTVLSREWNETGKSMNSLYELHSGLVELKLYRAYFF
jgi:hypothetical protein